jgi:hypothetical protein
MSDDIRFLEYLMETIESICEKNNIEYLAQFQMNKGKGLVYHYQSDDVLLDGATVMSQYQKLQLRNK